MANQKSKTNRNTNLAFKLIWVWPTIGTYKCLNIFLITKKCWTLPQMWYSKCQGKEATEENKCLQGDLSQAPQDGWAYQNPIMFLQESAIFVVFVFICMFRSKGSVVKNIYMNIYIYIASAISFHFFPLKTYRYIKKDSKNVGNAHWCPEDHVLFQKPYSQPSPLLLKVAVYTRVSAILRFVLHFIFYH